VRVVTGTVTMLALQRPELGTSGTSGVPDQMAAVHLGRFVVFVAERAIVFHQFVDGVAVGTHTVKQTRRQTDGRRTGTGERWLRRPGVGSVQIGRRSDSPNRLRRLLLITVAVAERPGKAFMGR